MLTPEEIRALREHTEMTQIQMAQLFRVRPADVISSTLAELLQLLSRLLGFRTVGVFFLDLLKEKPRVTCILQFCEGIALLEHSCCDFWILAMLLYDLIKSHNSRLILLLSIQGFADQILCSSCLGGFGRLLQILLEIHHCSLVILLLVIFLGAFVQLVSDICLYWY